MQVRNNSDMSIVSIGCFPLPSQSPVCPSHRGVRRGHSSTPNCSVCSSPDLHNYQQLNSLPTTSVSTTCSQLQYHKGCCYSSLKTSRKTETGLERKAARREPCLPWADLISNVCQVIQLSNLFWRFSFAMCLHCSQDLLQASFRSLH